jgi:putative membrane protein
MAMLSDNPATELAGRRTGMAFQRTRMAAERTLMAVVRTALSMISFGFTIHQLAEKAKNRGLIAHDGMERHFGIGLVALGIALLAMGIFYHLRFMHGLRHERAEMAKEGLIHGESRFPPSATLVGALLLLIGGIVTIFSLIF